jgi:SAM-dependent methyltransferase
MPSADELIDEALKAPLSGWDFSWLEGRATESHPPWGYTTLVQDAMERARRVLDIDTGGGEFLSRIAPVPSFVVATEGYQPNVGIAGERLMPIGIPVVQSVSAPDNVDQQGLTPSGTGSVLPFRDGVFDLVIDRHSSYWASEVWRVLVEGGRFLTQQRTDAGAKRIGWGELFGRDDGDGGAFDLGFAAAQLQHAGFTVERALEADTPLTFRDLAAVVYYLRAVPWAVDGFDPVDDREALEHIHERIRRDGALTVRGSHMLLDARRS